MIYRVFITLLAILAGGWMLFDGIHVLLRGKYFGPEKPGPWSELFIRMHINPFSLGPLFIGLGVLWLVFLIGVLQGQSWGWRGMVAVAIGSLWYLPIGTVLAGLALVLLFIQKDLFVR